MTGQINNIARKSSIVFMMLSIFFVSSCITTLPKSPASAETDPKFYQKDFKPTLSQEKYEQKVGRSSLIGMSDKVFAIPLTTAYLRTKDRKHKVEEMQKKGFSQKKIEQEVNKIIEKEKELYHVDNKTCFQVIFHAGSGQAQQDGEEGEYWSVQLNATIDGKKTTQDLKLEFDEKASWGMNRITKNGLGVEVSRSTEFMMYEGLACASSFIDYSEPFDLELTLRFYKDARSKKLSPKVVKLEWLPKS